MKKALLLLLILFPILVDAQVKGVKHVILIGIDGLGANYLKQANIPELKAAMKEGAYTMHARCVRPSSSADNWAAMFMGSSPSLTGYTKWDSKIPEIPPRITDQYGMFPTIFSVMRQQRPQAEIGIIYNWGGVGYLFPKGAVNLDEHITPDTATTQHAIQYIKNKKPNLLFVHLGEVDGAGHTIGWGTNAYYKAIHKMDSEVGQIIQAVIDADIMNESIIIITADHGGTKKGHGGITLKELEIPWIALGHGIKKGKQLTQSIMTFDTAATIAWIFGLNPPQVWIGRPIKSAFKF
ncbi:MAG TPA: alkaline phosphatase [Chitinophagaceae bacterium]|nr:alkaline phosphatase [Chitinophagaceae bacterium]